jgi:SAM-dependent methyltransferase
VPSSHPKVSIYESPRLYDLAFSFRDIPKECDGLLAIAKKHGAKAIRSVVELASGPAHHLREYARRGIAAYGVDVSREMIGYAKGLAKRDGVAVSLARADMRSFRLESKVDLAFCLFDSFTHCTSDRDGVEALRSTAANLKAKGLFILELTHPADYFSVGNQRTLGRWTERHKDVIVSARYDSAGRDAVAETYMATMTIDAKYRSGRPPRRIVSRQLHRMWLHSAVSNIAARSGVFEVVGWYGDLSSRVSLSMKLEAWRMVVVLRKR